MHKKSAKYFNLISNHIILVGIVCGIFYWIFESFAHTLIFKSDSFYTHLFKLTPHELWMRLGVILYFLILSVYAQYIINRNKKTEESLRRSEEKFRNLIESLPIGVSISTPEGNVLEINSALWKMAGYASKEEFLKFPASAHYYDTKDRERFIELIKRDGQVKDFEVQIRRKDNSLFWVSANSIIQRDESGMSLIINAVEDVTQRKLLEDEIMRYQSHLESLIKERTSELQKEIAERKRTEDMYRLLFNSSNDAIFVYKLTYEGKYGKFIEVNDTACNRLGYSREELLKLSVQDINPPEMVKVLPEKVKKILAEKYILIETEHVTKDGRRIPTEVNSHLFELDGHPAVLSTARDITDRKILEAERIRVLKEVGGALNHEINNPLASIITTIYLLQNRHEEDKYTSQRLSMLRENTERIREKVTKLSNAVAVVSADYPGGEKIIDIEKSANQGL